MKLLQLLNRFFSKEKKYVLRIVLYEQFFSAGYFNADISISETKTGMLLLYKYKVLLNLNEGYFVEWDDRFYLDQFLYDNTEIEIVNDTKPISTDNFIIDMGILYFAGVDPCQSHKDAVTLTRQYGEVVEVISKTSNETYHEYISRASSLFIPDHY